MFNEEQLCQAINAYLLDPHADRAAQERFLVQECTYIDGTAGKRTAEFFLSIVEDQRGG